MQVRIGYKKPLYRYPKGALKQLARLASLGNIGSVVRFALRDTRLKSQVIAEVGKIVSNELKFLCSNKFNSVLMETSQTALEFFSWESLWLEMVKATPVLLALLQACTPKQANPKRMQPVVCMCTGILAKFRNHSACLVQSLISMILQAGYASKQATEMLLMMFQVCSV